MSGTHLDNRAASGARPAVSGTLLGGADRLRSHAIDGPGRVWPTSRSAGGTSPRQEVVESGVNHIDTAQYYGPDVVNELILEALYRYPPELVLVSKVGARRDQAGGIFAYDDPAQLRQGIEHK
jgi:aryl-alcohol dehydrogenase-like predicted oxidoreductase